MTQDGNRISFNLLVSFSCQVLLDLFLAMLSIAPSKRLTKVWFLHHVFQSYADLKTLTAFWILVWNNSFLHSSQLFSKAGHYPDWRKQTGQTGINSFPLKWPRPSLKVKPRVGFWKRTSISLKNTCWHMTSAFVTHPSNTFQTELEPEAAFTHLFLWTVLLPWTKKPLIVPGFTATVQFELRLRVSLRGVWGGCCLHPWTCGHLTGSTSVKGNTVGLRAEGGNSWIPTPADPEHTTEWGGVCGGGYFQQKLAQNESNWC